jgi:hypothetical protein
LNSQWGSLFPHSDAIMIVDGIDSDNAIKNKTLAFQSWFFKIEFIDCIMCITKEMVIFLGVPEKVKFFAFMEENFKKSGKKVVLIERQKGEIKDAISKLMTLLKSNGCNKIGMILKEE